MTDQWREKKILIRELWYRGEEKHGEEREERQLERERSIGRGETKVSDIEGVRREKVRKLTMRERRRQKIMFPTTIHEDNIYRRCNAWEKDCFPKKKMENNL